MTLDTYLDRCRQSFALAARQQPLVEHTVRMADVSIRLCSAGPAPAAAVMPALAHVAADGALGGEPDISFELWDAASTGVHPPRPPFSSEDYRRYGNRAVACTGSIALMHAPAAGQILAYDRAARRGLFWVVDASSLSIYERAAPLQTLFHWALAESGWQIVHGAAVGTEQGGVLLVGNTGAGKSTTALSCLTGNAQSNDSLPSRAQPGSPYPSLRFLSDDKCLVRLDPVPQAFAAFSSGKIKTDMLDRLPQFRDRLEGWDEDFKAGKGLVFLYPDYAERLITTFAVKALVIPSVARQDRATVRPVTARDAFRVFGPSTVIWLPGAESDNYRFTAALVRRLPCYQLDLALDPERNADAIRELLSALAETSSRIAGDRRSVLLEAP